MKKVIFILMLVLCGITSASWFGCADKQEVKTEEEVLADNNIPLFTIADNWIPESFVFHIGDNTMEMYINDSGELDFKYLGDVNEIGAWIFENYMKEICYNWIKENGRVQPAQ